MEPPCFLCHCGGPSSLSFCHESGTLETLDERSNLAKKHTHVYHMQLKICSQLISSTNVQVSRVQLVSFPDPSLKEGKGLVYIERFLGLDDISLLNSRAPDSCHAVYP